MVKLVSHPLQYLASSEFSNRHFGHFIVNASQIYRKVDLRDKRWNLLALIRDKLGGYHILQHAFCYLELG